MKCAILDDIKKLLNEVVNTNKLAVKTFSSTTAMCPFLECFSLIFSSMDTLASHIHHHYFLALVCGHCLDLDAQDIRQKETGGKAAKSGHRFWLYTSDDSFQVHMMGNKHGGVTKSADDMKSMADAGCEAAIWPDAHTTHAEACCYARSLRGIINDDDDAAPGPSQVLPAAMKDATAGGSSGPDLLQQAMDKSEIQHDADEDDEN